METIMIRVDRRPDISRRWPARLWAWLGAFTLKRARPDHTAALSPELLRDIGVTRRDYRGASGRMYWDAPDHWFDDPSRD